MILIKEQSKVPEVNGEVEKEGTTIVLPPVKETVENTDISRKSPSNCDESFSKTEVHASEKPNQNHDDNFCDVNSKSSNVSAYLKKQKKRDDNFRNEAMIISAFQKKQKKLSLKSNKNLLKN